MKVMTCTVLLQVLLLVTCLRFLVRGGSITLETTANDVILGHPVTLTCRVSDAAAGLVTFLMQEGGTYAVVCRLMVTTGNIVGTPTYPCLRVEEQQQEVFSLTVGRTSLKHGTAWMCQAAGMKSNTVHLDIQYIQYFGVTSGNGIVTVTEHDNVIMQCNTSSSVSSIEIWDETSTLGSGTNSSTVEARIEDVDCRHAGPYTCSARNLIGQAVERNISLQVKCSPRPDESTPGGRVFRSPLNRSITLSLAVIAFPEPTFSWNTTSGGQPLTNTNVTTEGFRVTGSATISDVKEEDFQNYTVIVANTEGTRMLSVMLIPLSQPDTPRNLQVSSITPGSVTLTWEKGANGGARQRFKIQYRQDGGHWTSHPIMLSEDGDLRLELGGLEADTTYTVRLLAFNQHGTSNYTSISVTTAPPQPDTPRNLQVSSITPWSVTLTWEKGSNGGARPRFKIQYRRDGGHWTSHPTILSEDGDLRLELGGLEADTTYTVRLFAFNQHGTSNYTSISVTTAPHVSDSSSTVVVARGTTCAAVVVFAIITTL